MEINAQFISGLLRVGRQTELFDGDVKYFSRLTRNMQFYGKDKESLLSSKLMVDLIKLIPIDIPSYKVAWTLAKGLRVFDLGIIGYYLYSCPNLQEGLKRLEGVNLLFSNFISSSFYKEKSICTWSLDFPTNKQTQHFRVHRVNVFLGLFYRYKIVSALLQTKINITHVNINLPHLTIDERNFVKKIFNCSITTKPSQMCSISYNADDLPDFLPSYNSIVFENFNKMIYRNIVEGTNGVSSYEKLVSYLIKNEIRNPQFSFSYIARKIGVSERTLQRMLKKENTSFTSILKNCRIELALRYLYEGNTKREIAKKLNFSEVNSFYRAFKKWHGVSPEEFKQNQTKRHSFSNIFNHNKSMLLANN